MYALTPAAKLVSILTMPRSLASADACKVCHADSTVERRWCTRIWMSPSMTDGAMSPSSSDSVPDALWRARSIWIIRSCAIM